MILTAGWEDREVATPILARFGLALDGIPLGRAEGQGRLGSARFYRACSVVDTGSQPPMDVLCQASGFPIAVRKSHGSGSFVHIADSCFFYNKNLEGQSDFVVEENVAFLRALLRELKE